MKINELFVNSAGMILHRYFTIVETGFTGLNSLQFGHVKPVEAGAGS